MVSQAQDFLAECDALYSLLENLDESAMECPTQFKSWTGNDILGHLYLFDVGAGITLESREDVQSFFSRIKSGRASGKSLIQYTRDWLEGCSGHALRERWYEHARALSARYAAEDPRRRVAWGGPDMSVRSCISARQMETWAHGQALFDQFGVERQETDRVHNIAVMGVNTFSWSFVTNQLEVPPHPPAIELISPSGTSWHWHTESGGGLVSGSAVDFCRVVTQVRNVADTRLLIEGETARRWMQIAQCFAGPAETPPRVGARFRLPREVMHSAG